MEGKDLSWGEEPRKITYEDVLGNLKENAIQAIRLLNADEGTIVLRVVDARASSVIVDAEVKVSYLNMKGE